ncbi:MAG: hypothetical protein K9M49_05280 [Candidatus Marinimicrobia bacterium]|nr:hypothetical protein [Candidatus Neomarinimicrobiota bacterium]MCF7850402.1 hypothetical protein [Candidatus Neomarinimicrobiota bacterium]MCF7904549.1 hypothetical protein [Candidatus Neomarinimicrobiota bacterium]
MHPPIKKAIQILGIWMALWALGACSNEPEPAGEVLARIGDRVITTEDFQRRAEYTLRPDYCAGDNYIHKKIVLNSLIAEKLLALEFSDSPLKSDPTFQAYIQGRQEQVMRQWMQKTHGRDLVSIDSSALKDAFRLSSRIYHVQFLVLPDSNAAMGWGRARRDGIGFNEIAAALTGSDTIPGRAISWFDRELESVWQVIFEQEQTKGNVLGPLPLDDGTFIVLRIDGWVDRPDITDDALQQRWIDVTERMIERQADRIYKSYVGELMSDKQLQLNKPVFWSYSKRISDIYLEAEDEKKQLLNAAIWEVEEGLLNQEWDELPEVDGSEILFEIDQQEWSIDRFEEYLLKHPLVFRKRKMNTSEFAEQFKYAIADLVRDYYITEQAYRLNYDQVPNVHQYTETFEDHYLSRQARKEYLRSRVKVDSLKQALSNVELIQTYLDPLVDTLQAKYSPEIKINMELFESIKLSTVPMMVGNRNVPFPLAVPAFPRLTTDNRIDYGENVN